MARCVMAVWSSGQRRYAVAASGIYLMRSLREMLPGVVTM